MCTLIYNTFFKGGFKREKQYYNKILIPFIEALKAGNENALQKITATYNPQQITALNISKQSILLIFDVKDEINPLSIPYCKKLFMIINKYILPTIRNKNARKNLKYVKILRIIHGN